MRCSERAFLKRRRRYTATMSDDIVHLIVEISARRFRSLGLQRLDESRWVPSEHRGYCLRVDPARPEMHQRRHVHIARDKHTAAKHKQVAWNDDGTRHDQKSFNTAFQSMATAKDIARKALRTGDDVIFESVSPADHILLVTESVLNESLDSDADLTKTVCLVLRD